MSEVKMSGRKIDFFRCHIDPSIGPRPKNAFKIDDPQCKGMEAEMTPIGVYVKFPMAGGIMQESLVPYPNIQSIRLRPELATVTELPLGKEKKNV